MASPVKSFNSWICFIRVMLDSLRTLLVWTFALAVSWQKFAWLHLIGFVLLILGMFVYNKMIFDEESCTSLCIRNKEEDQNKEKLWTAGQIKWKTSPQLSREVKTSETLRRRWRPTNFLSVFQIFICFFRTYMWTNQNFNVIITEALQYLTITFNLP